MPNESTRSKARHGRISRRRLDTQRGSALLVVLVFAAIIAIMLYKELPVAAFEAQRQKEDRLVSRGNEYKRAVRLFVRKVGRFPNSMDELENTNRMRFLRRRYTDPLTGKDDWRIIHAGPGGIITDSKVKSKNDGTSSNLNALGQGALFAGFNNSFSGDSDAQAQTDTNNPAFRQRPPATKNAASVPSDSLGLPQENNDPNGQSPVDPATGQPTPNGQAGLNGQLNAAGGSNGIATVQDQLNNMNPPTQALPGQPGNPAGFGNTASFGNTQGNGNQANAPGNGNSLMGNAGNGLIGGAGIAGVASNAVGASIKAINEQTKYNLWEFYYDLRKDQLGAMAAALAAQQNGSIGVPTNGSPGFAPTPPAGGQPSGFGSSPSPGTPPATPPTSQ